MELTASNQIDLATLPGNAGYRVLMQCLWAHEEELLAAMRGTWVTSDLINKTRYWQCFSKIVSLLEKCPYEAAVDLDNQQANFSDVAPDIEWTDPIYTFVNNRNPFAPVSKPVQE